MSILKNGLLAQVAGVTSRNGLLFVITIYNYFSKILIYKI